jgi:hypothetical protein
VPNTYFTKFIDHPKHFWRMRGSYNSQILIVSTITKLLSQFPHGLCRHVAGFQFLLSLMSKFYAFCVVDEIISILLASVRNSMLYVLWMKLSRVFQQVVEILCFLWWWWLTSTKIWLVLWMKLLKKRAYYSKLCCSQWRHLLLPNPSNQASWKQVMWVTPKADIRVKL